MHPRTTISTKRTRSSRTFICVAILILWGLVAVRYANLLALPLFIDEATGINRARDSLMGAPFQGLAHAKWLGTAILALFRPFGLETLWLSRAVTGLLSALTCASAMALGRSLGGRASGLLSGLAYLALPYSVFLDRQALADPLLAAFSAVLLVASFRLARSPQALHAAVTGAALSAAILSKFSGVVLFPVPLITALLIAQPNRRRRALALAGAATLLAALLLLAVFTYADRYLQSYQSIVNDDYSWGWLRRHAGLEADDAPLPVRWAHSLQRLGESVPYFLGWPLAAVGLASPILVADRRQAAWLWIAGPLALLPMLAVVTWLPVRYLSFAVGPLVAMASAATLALAERVGRRWKSRRAARVAGGLFILALLVPLLPRSFRLLTEPQQADMPPFERLGYYGPTDEGSGVMEVYDVLRAYARSHAGPVHVIYSNVSPLELYILWGVRQGALRGWEDSASQRAELAGWLVADEEVIFVDGGEIGERPYDARTEWLAAVAGPPGITYQVRWVTAPGPDLTREIYNQVAGNPAGIRDSYQMLAGQLPAGQTIAYFPPHQDLLLDEIMGGGTAKLVALGEGWPPDVAAIQEQLSTLASQTPTLSLVFFNETAGDPQRQIESWLNTHLFRLGEWWAGALRVVDYVSPVDGTTITRHDVTLGDRIRLIRSEVAATRLNGTPVLLIELQMEAVIAIERSYKVGAYVLDGHEAVVAQYDSIPQGYIAPTTGWIAGQPIVDRFAVRLPATLPAGRYRLVMALYDEATLEQLPASALPGRPTLIELYVFTVD